MTARAMKGDAEHCRLAGMDGYLPKPIKSADLYAIVDGCCSMAETGSNTAIAAEPVGEIIGTNAEESSLELTT
jgi:CheY-like chemotaxis protein